MLEQYPLGDQVRELCNAKRKAVGAPALPAPTNTAKPAPAYEALLPRLLVPALWETQGAVAALARLMQAYLLHNVQAVVSTNKASLTFSLLLR